MPQHATGNPLSRAEWAFLAALFGGCLLIFATQEMNPFPYDGWFESQYRVLHRDPGGWNFSPVAAPAFLYGGIHWLASRSGLDLEAEMKLAALAHQLMLALAGVWLYLSHRRLAFGWWGAAATALTVLFVESTYLPQSFWSENVTLFLVSLSVWLTLEIAANGAASPARFWGLATALALGLGLATITRATPILLLPAAIVFVRADLPLRRRRPFAVGLTAMTAAIVMAQMGANQWRYGRWELSHSTGLHLWDGVSFASDGILAESALYARMKTLKPDIQGCWWWELPRPADVAATMTDLEDAVRPMVIEGILRHPHVFLAEGVRNLVRALPRAPHAIGKNPMGESNPLGRDSYLPAWRPNRLISRTLAAVHEPGRSAYGGVLVAGLAGGALWWAALWLRSAEERRRRWGDRSFRAWAWLAFVLVGMVYVSNQIEKMDPRFALPYVGVVALLASLGARLAVQAMGRGRS